MGRYMIEFRLMQLQDLILPIEVLYEVRGNLLHENVLNLFLLLVVLEGLGQMSVSFNRLKIVVLDSAYV
jgi:hypothetical protein